MIQFLLMIQPCLPKQRDQWIQFLDSCFTYNTEIESYGVDFAPLFEDEALQNSRLIFLDNKIVSSASMMKRTVICPHRKYEVGVIGAVATHPMHRGQGYSTQLINELEQEAQRQELDFLILWSDNREFYSRLGFKPGGQQILANLHSLTQPKGQSKGKATKGWDWNQIPFIYNLHPYRLNRSTQYWSALQKITSTQYYQWISQGEIKAYLAWGRGKDFHNVIHEWGGSPIALHHLVYHVLQINPDLLWLTHPLLQDPILKLLNSDTKAKSELALIKPLSKDPRLLPEALDHIWFWGLDST